MELRFESTVTLDHLETALPDYALEIEALLEAMTLAIKNEFVYVRRPEKRHGSSADTYSCRRPLRRLPRVAWHRPLQQPTSRPKSLRPDRLQ